MIESPADYSVSLSRFTNMMKDDHRFCTNAPRRGQSRPQREANQTIPDKISFPVAKFLHAKHKNVEVFPHIYIKNINGNPTPIQDPITFDSNGLDSMTVLKMNHRIPSENSS